MTDDNKNEVVTTEKVKKKNTNKNKDTIKVIPIGGLGAIGRNMTLFEYRDEIVIVDCGIMFPDDEQPGIDFIIPDFSYVVKNKHKVKAILITHGHEDHIGAVPFLLKEITAPIYATKLTIGLIQSRLIERQPKDPAVFHEVKPRDEVQIGQFKVGFIKVNHSIADGVAIALQTDLGTIIHTGDFKIDFSPVDGAATDISRFAEYGEKGVLLLLSDSTNAERSGHTKSESLLINKLESIFSGAKGRVIVASFASNIHRIQQVLDVAQKYNRKVLISGLTMQKNIEIASSLGYLTYKEGLIVDKEEAATLPYKKQIIIGTGTQGEPMSALSRMANGTHKHFRAERGDTIIITASVIPGNGKMIRNVVNALMKLGAEVFHEQENDIHVSGHASEEELKLMLTITKPKFFMPVHGEYKHMVAHKKIAELLNIKSSKILIADNGDILELTSKEFKKKSKINLTDIYVDGKDIGDVGSSLIKDRHVMSKEGVVFITIVTSEGMLLRKPLVISKGFIGNKNTKIMELIQKEVDYRLNRMLVEGLTGKNIEAALNRKLYNMIYKVSRRNPVIEINVLEI